MIDLRSLSPIDFDTIEESVRKTGRLVVAHEAPTFLGLGAEIAARISERCFYQLDAPVLRVGGFDVPYPRRSWNCTICRTPTACSTRSIAASRPDRTHRRRGAVRWRRNSAYPISVRA